MATTTNHLGLTLPAGTEPVSLQVLNDNWRKVEAGILKALRGKAARNLLDNSDFRLNQRMRPNTTSSGVYCVDRWIASASSDAPIYHNGGADYIGMKGGNSITQLLPADRLVAGRTYTLAVYAAPTNYRRLIIASGTTSSSVGTYIQTAVDNINIALYKADGSDNWCVQISNTGTATHIPVYWAALYEGAYTADTLPEYVPKGYAAELAECQRYYRTVNRAFGEAIGNVSREIILFPAPMRVTPTITTLSLWQGMEGTGYTIIDVRKDYFDIQYTGWGNLQLAISADL